MSVTLKGLEEQHFEELSTCHKEFGMPPSWRDHWKHNEQPDTLDANTVETDKTQILEELPMSPKIGMLCRLFSNEEESLETKKEHEQQNEVQEKLKVHCEENNDFVYLAL